MSKLPEVRIRYAYLLAENASVHINKLLGDGTPIYSYDEYQKIAESYKNGWKPYEKKILTAMCEILDLQFYQNTIDVYIAPWFSAFSDPMVIGVTETPDTFVDTLTHEVIHRLVSDNTTLPQETFLIPEWGKLFGFDDDWVTLVHIPVYAVHKKIYLEVLNDKAGVERDVKLNKKFKATSELKAWEYVNDHDYNEIIEMLKKSYKDIANQLETKK